MRQEGPAFVILRPRARRDAFKQQQYYQQINLRLAQDFNASLESSLATLADAPQRWAEYSPGVRRFLLTRFPVTIFYRVMGSSVHVLRILDQRRHPDTWRTP